MSQDCLAVPLRPNLSGRLCFSPCELDTQLRLSLTPLFLPLVPDAPFNLQLSLKKEAEGVVTGCWSPPVNAHGLIREFIVSPAAWRGRVRISGGMGKAAGGSQQRGLACLNTAISAEGGGPGIGHFIEEIC